MIQITEPIAIAAFIPSIPVCPLLLITIVEIRSVAIAIPETGLLELPIIPTIREDTVAKKNPKITIRSAPSGLTGIAGTAQMITTIAMIPIRIKFIGRSWSVLAVPLTDPPFMLFMESRNVLMISGMDLIREMIPPVAMAPAPIYLTYLLQIAAAPPFAYRSAIVVPCAAGYSHVSGPNRQIIGMMTIHPTSEPTNMKDAIRGPTI